jgi:capsular polysaccharide biosynthesis protein
MGSSPVLARAVKLSGRGISVETLRQRLEIEIAQDADLLTIRVVDPTGTGAAQLANAIPAAYEQVVARRSREVAAQLLRARSEQLKTRLAEAEAELARNPADPRLQTECRILTDQDREVLRQLRALERSRPVLVREPAAVPKQPTMSPGPGRATVIGMLLGLLAAAVVVWWRTRGQGPTSRSSTPEQGATSHLG